MGQYVVTLLLSPSGIYLEHADLLGSPNTVSNGEYKQACIEPLEQHICPASPV